jgi:hypothetical protein
MANQPDLTVWHERWLALDSAIDSYEQAIANYGQFPRSQTLRRLARDLRAFAEGQFRFFYDGFDQHKLDLDSEMPLAHVFWVTLDQVAADLGLFQQAVAQHLWGTEETRQMLKAAEAVALAALSPMEAYLDGPTTVLIYCHKFPSIRVIPYARVAIIGIPFTCASVPRDYLAIPHEVGHYVFWRGKSNGKSIGQALKAELEASPQVPDWARDWGEEIFADIYGYLSAGPLMALSCQDLQCNYAQDKLFEDDGEHPLPAMRSYIYTAYLEKKGLGVLAGKLKDRLENRLGKPDNKKKFAPKSLKARIDHISLADLWQLLVGMPTLSDAIDRAGAVIDKVGGQLEGKAQMDGWFASLYQDLGALPDLDELYTKWEARFTSQPPNLPARVSQDLVLNAPAWSWTDWFGKTYPSIQVVEGQPIAKETWRSVLLANGWATKLPSSWII